MIRSLTVNGTRWAAEPDPGRTVLDFVRDVCGLLGTKAGCERGECGTCTVLIDGKPVHACTVLADVVDGEVRTIEGVADAVAPLREALAERGGFQCGFCTPGIVMRCAPLLQGPALGPDEVRQALGGNVCRCTGYDAVVAAVVQATAEAGRAHP